MLSAGAFNALLKTMEEPPPHVKFILATTEIHKSSCNYRVEMPAFRLSQDKKRGHRFKGLCILLLRRALPSTKMPQA